MRTTRQPCPVPEVLSAFLDGELRASEQPFVTAHVSGCERCTRELRALQTVDALLQRQPDITLPRFDTSLLHQRRRKVPRFVVIFLILFALAAVAAGGTAVGIKLAHIFRTDKNVQTQPVESFPTSSNGGSEIQITPAPGAEEQVWPVPQVEAALKTHLLQPTYIPEGYSLVQRSAPLELNAQLLYLGGGTSINISESNHVFGTVERPPVPPEAAEQVDINGHLGIYIKGGWRGDPPAWDPNLVHSVTFDVEIVTVEISAPLTVSKDALIRIALSMQ